MNVKSGKHSPRYYREKVLSPRLSRGEERAKLGGEPGQRETESWKKRGRDRPDPG